MMDEQELDQIRSVDKLPERMELVFLESGPTEAMVDRENVEPICWIEAEPYDEEDQKTIMNRAKEIDIGVGEAILVHETSPNRAADILSQGFDNPFEHAGENTYHVLSSVRYEKVFLWPHVSTFGTHDIKGAAVICRTAIEDVLVSSYGSFGSLVDWERYQRKKEWGLHDEAILPDEYNEYHVFDYSTYIEWIEGGGGEFSFDSLLPYWLS